MTECGRRLGDLDYTEEAVRGWLGGVEASERRLSHAPGYLWRLQQVGTLGAALAGFGLLRAPLPARTAREIFGEALEVLERLRLVERSGERVLPLAGLYPCQGVHLFVLTDLTGDSYCLARTTPRNATGTALDLGTGPGMQALLAGGHAQGVQGVDVSSRSVELAEVNAVLNGLDLRCRFSQGHLFEPVKGRRFDLITANLPFAPLPLEDRLAGAEAGEDRNRRLLASLAEHLAPDGTLALHTNYSVRRQPGEVLERVADWLGGSRGWGLAQLHHATHSREEFIEQQLSGGAPDDFRRWMDSYESQSIEGMGVGTILVRRLSQGHPGFQRTLEMGRPSADLGARVADWLDSLERYLDPTWQPAWEGRLELHPNVQSVYEDLKGGSAWATFAPGWTFGQELPGAALQLVRASALCSPDELCERLGWSRAAVRELAASLGAALVLTG